MSKKALLIKVVSYSNILISSINYTKKSIIAGLSPFHRYRIGAPLLQAQLRISCPMFQQLIAQPSQPSQHFYLIVGMGITSHSPESQYIIFVEFQNSYCKKYVHTLTHKHATLLKKISTNTHPKQHRFMGIFII